MSLALIAAASLGAIGGVSAIILYGAAKKFVVIEDPRLAEVEAALPAANCGGCGFPGCKGFADALIKADDLSELYCPVGKEETMKTVAAILGKTVEAKAATVAVVRCAGSCANRPRTNLWDGAKSCAVVSMNYSGDTGCSFGCHGLGDCVFVCKFDAIVIDEETRLPVVDEEKCTSCGACVKACPNSIIQIRKKGPKSRRIYVSCVNKDKGVVAKKACATACIGCGKCQKICPHEAITIENNIAYIDDNKCKLCRKCVPECPTSAIIELNFPPRKTSEIQDTATN